MLNQNIHPMQPMTKSSVFSISQWLPFTWYQIMPKFPRFAPNSFMFMPNTFFQYFISWHNHYATVFPHTKKYRMLRAIAVNDLQQIVQFLQDGFPVNTPVDAKYGYNCLQIATINNNYPLIQILLLRGADIHVKDRWGNTPLHLAVVNRNHQAINSLMKNGSDPTIQNKYGVSSINKAEGNSNIKQFLERYSSQKRNFPHFRPKLKFEQKLKNPFWQQIEDHKIYSSKVRPHMMSKWQFDFTEASTVEQILKNEVNINDKQQK